MRYLGPKNEAADIATQGDLSGGGSLALDDLTDVAISSPQIDQVLKYGASGWVNGSSPMKAPYCRIGRNTDSGTATNSLTLQLIGMIHTFEETLSGMADLANNQIVIQEAGLYFVSAVLTYAPSATGVRRVAAVTSSVMIAQNELGGVNPGSDGQTVTANSLWRFSAGQTIQLFQGQNSGAALNMYGDGTAGKHTYLEALKVRD